MPATPRFKVSQTDLAVVVCIKVPHIRVGSAETHVDGTEFSFYCKPYLLRLTLPYEVGGDDDDGSCKAVYDPSDENGTITVTLKKVIPGQHFPDLDLTTTLMQPRWTPKDLLKERPSGGDEGGAEGDVPASSFSGVEVVSSERYDVHDDGDDEAAGTNGRGSSVGADGSGGSRLPAGGAGVVGTDAGAAEARRAGGRGGGMGAEVLIRPPSYGFNDKFSGFFTSLREELREMIHLPDPDNTPPEARRGLRLEHEQAAFDPDRYLGDLFAEEEDPLLTEALAFEPHWRLRLRAQQQRHRRRQRRRGQAQEQEKRNRREEEDRRQGVDGGGGGASHAGSGGGEGAPEDEALLQGERGGVEGAVEAEAEGREDGGQDEEEAGFSEAEQEQMRRLPNREYLIEAGSSEERRVLLGLADILFAYAYDHRTTTGDATVESPWTVAVLSPLLSWLEAPAEGGGVAESSPVTTDASAETDVALAGIRRSLIFPYLRVWELGALVARDVRDILAAGKRCILRCLLQTYALMERGEVHYLLNKLFIEDYCVWIQKASEESLAALAESYAAAAASITKSGACLGLERIEADAERMIAAGEGGSEDEEESSAEASSEEEDSSEESWEESTEESSDEESSADEDGGGGGGGGEEKKAEAQPGGDEASGVGIGRTSATPSTQAHSSEALASPAAGHDANTAADDADATALSNEAAKSGASGAASTAGSTENGSGISSSGGKHGERDPQRSTTPAVAPGRTGADDDDASEPSASRAVERNTDLLQLESLAGKASLGGGTSSSALASKLSGLSLGEHGAPILPGGRVCVGKVVEGSPPPLPPPSSEAVGSSADDGCSGGGEEGMGRRKKLIEEL